MALQVTLGSITLTNEQGLSKDHHASRHADNLIASVEFLHEWVNARLMGGL